MRRDFTGIDEVPIEPHRARVYVEGWQSWSPSGWYQLSEAPPRPETAWQHLMRFRPGDDLPDAGFQGWGLLVLDPGTGAPVRRYAIVQMGRDVPAIRAVQRGERVIISTDEAGQVRLTEFESALAALADFGEQFATSAGVQMRPAPTVWCTWYRYFLDVTEQDVLENLREIDARELPVDVIQIDDGWQSHIGDWARLSERFGSLSELVAQIKATGRRAGIWLAPFIVHPDSELALAHPEWLSGPAGTNWGSEQLRGLDLSHPGAQEYLWHIFRDLRELGFDYFKLDFLYAGALPGQRHRDLTEVEAYRTGLALVREAVGAEAYLLGCGAPILPSVGLVDAMRVSPDTFHPEGQDGSRGLRGKRSAVQRSWQQGRFWINDPDCFVGRPSYTLREEWAQVVEKYGGLRSFSDRITELDDWALRTVARQLATTPAPVPFAETRRP